MSTNKSLSAIEQAFMDSYIEAHASGKPLPTSPEELPEHDTNTNIISVPLHNPRNTWMENLCVEKMVPSAILPTRESEFAAGYDLYAFEDGVVHPYSQCLCKLKIKIHMPPGVYGRIAPRSGLSYRNGIQIGGGVIDADYQGEVGVILMNSKDQVFTFKRGDRIAQLILEKCTIVPIREVKSIVQIFGDTTRGSEGFGSTGR